MKLREKLLQRGVVHVLQLSPEGPQVLEEPEKHLARLQENEWKHFDSVKVCFNLSVDERRF